MAGVTSLGFPGSSSSSDTRTVKGSPTTKPMKVYVNEREIDPANRRNVVALAKHLLKARDGRPHFEPVSKSFQLVDHPSSADFVLLPMEWNYYVDHNRISRAAHLRLEAHAAGREFVVISTGDFPANLPFSDAVLFQVSGTRSRRLAREYAFPPVITDRVAQSFGGELPLRSKGRKPVVGFCGQSASGVVDHMARVLMLKARRCKYAAGLARWEPPESDHTWLRHRVLKELSKSPAVTTNFIVRKKYQGGQPGADHENPRRVAFVENLRDSDYVVCVRGLGNWSLRFYETLCMGRIPVFVDTDCVLPFEHVIDWRKLCVWVHSTELSSIGTKVAEYHERHSDREFCDRQRELREIWRRYLDAAGFYDQFHLHFDGQVQEHEPIGR